MHQPAGGAFAAAGAVGGEDGMHRRHGEALGMEEQGEHAPTDDGDAHDGGELHDFHGFVGAFPDADDVGPPEVDSDADGDDHAERIDGLGAGGGIEDDGMFPALADQGEQVADEPDQVLAGGDGADGAGEDVIEHEGGDGEFGEAAAHGFFDDFIHAATGEHGAAFHVHRADGVGKEHDAEDEPGGGLADGLLADAADVVGGGGQVAEHDGGGAPEADEHQRDGGDHQHIDFAFLRGVGNFRAIEIQGRRGAHVFQAGGRAAGIRARMRPSIPPVLHEQTPGARARPRCIRGAKYVGGKDARNRGWPWFPSSPAVADEVS